MQQQHGQEPQQGSIPGNLIVQGRNPRTYFDPVEQAELEASIKVKGVIQPILLRPFGDGYQIVAGERRWRGSCKMKGPDYPIPALIREMTDEEADEAALIENTHRAQMSPAEEAESAAKVLGQCGGNRDEAANRLGWDRSVLDKRLALMNCSDNVRKALTERRILLGHAELLAAVTKEKQDVVLERLLSVLPQPSPAELKAMLNQIARLLESAIFDKLGCLACQFNSGQQKKMFAESLESGNCTNAECFDGKTEAALAARAENLKEEYPVVRIVRAGENYTVLPVNAEGATGLGEEQATACRACKNFGAAVSAVPGKVGNVYTNTDEVIEELQSMEYDDDSIAEMLTPDKFDGGLPKWVLKAKKRLTQRQLKELGKSTNADVAGIAQCVLGLLKLKKMVTPFFVEEMLPIYPLALLRWNDMDSVVRLSDDIVHEANSSGSEYFTSEIHLAQVPREAQGFQAWRATMEPSLAAIKIANQLIGYLSVLDEEYR